MKRVEFGPGRHGVDLKITEPTTIVGAGRELTELAGTLVVAAPVRLVGLTLALGLEVGDAELEDVAVEGAPGHGLVVSGHLVARDVVFRRNAGAGLVVRGTAEVTRWLAEHNRGPGVLVYGAATVEAGLALCNGGDGIRFTGEARGAAYGNLCQGNLGHGVAIAGRARPVIEHQTLRENAGAGIACLDLSAARLRANTCDANRLAPVFRRAQEKEGA